MLFVYGIREMTMAQATTISFLSPLLITVLSIPLLGELVGIRRWAAVLAGMAGMLIVVRPGTGGFQPAALFGVASSGCWALALIITRKIAAVRRTEDHDPVVGPDRRRRADAAPAARGEVAQLGTIRFVSDVGCAVVGGPVAGCAGASAGTGIAAGAHQLYSAAVGYHWRLRRVR